MTLEIGENSNESVEHWVFVDILVTLTLWDIFQFICVFFNFFINIFSLNVQVFHLLVKFISIYFILYEAIINGIILISFLDNSLLVYRNTIFWKNMRKISINSLNVGGIHQCSHLVLGFSLLSFNYLDSNSLQTLVCSKFLFLHDSVLIDCIFLGISSRLSNGLAYNCS